MFSFSTLKQQVEELERDKASLHPSLLIPRRIIQEKIDHLKNALPQTSIEIEDF